MKKVTVFLIVAALLFVGMFAIGTIVENSSDRYAVTANQSAVKDRLDGEGDLYPVYVSFDEQYRDYYVKLCSGFESCSEVIFLDEFDSKEEMETIEEWLDENYRNIVYEQPDCFWIDPNSYIIEERQSGREYTLSAKPNYTLDKSEVAEKKEIYDAVVRDITDEAKRKDNVFDSVLYVYDTILSKTDYDHDLADAKDSSLNGYSAYGCLVDGKTVCSGYTLAFTSIMQKLGIVCGAEFDSMSDSEFFSGHVWNYCKLDGEYYYFDLTWDDTSFDSDELRKHLDYTHDYFAITSEELRETNLTVKENTTSPESTADKYNYYTYKNMYCEKYSFNDVRRIIKNQPQDDFAVIKFGSATERVKAEKDLFENQRLYEILTDVYSVKYIASVSGLHLYIFYE